MNLLTRILKPRQRLIKAALTISLSIYGILPTLAQDTPLTFERAVTTLEKVIEVIEQQTNYLFIYSAGILDVTMAVEVPVGKSTLSEILKILEPQMGYHAIVKRNYIVVYTAEPYRRANRQRQPRRTSDTFHPSDPAVVGIASNPRPVVIDFAQNTPIDIETNDAQAPIESPEPANSRIIPADLYSPMSGRLPFVAAKVNLLYGAATLTPNLAFELGIGTRHTIEIAGSHNYWNHKAKLEENKKLKHWIVRPEYRYWFCERYNGHFIGVHAFYSGYNISGKNVPLLFDKDYRYHGWAVGGGVSYGYHWAFAKKWGLEFNVGVGAAYLDYDRYSCKTCDRNAEAKTKTYVGPTRAGVSLVFMIK